VHRFGYTVESPVIHDPAQTAYVQFLRLPGKASFQGAKKGGGPNHLCYSVGDIEAAVTKLRDAGMITLCEPVDAVAFPGRRIAWLMGQDRIPVELVEKGELGQL